MLFELEETRVHVVSRGAEAEGAIAEFKPDAVILDISLPDMSGVDVYRRIEQRWPDLPVLFSSGHADSANLADVLSRPHTGFIAKPYEFEQVQVELARLLAADRRELMAV